jgi:hypothetical protein
MLFASFMFAIMGVCVKLASEEFSTSELVLYRGVVGIIVLGIAIRAQGGSFRTSMPYAHLWRGLVGVVSLWLWFYSIGKLPLATAMTLNYMAPIWMAVWLFAMGWWHAKNQVKWPLLAAVGLSFVGVTLLLQPAFHANLLAPALIALSSSMLSAMAYLQVRKLGLMPASRNTAWCFIFRDEPGGRHRRQLRVRRQPRRGLASDQHHARRPPAARHWHLRHQRADRHDARLPPRQHAGCGQPAIHRHRVFQHLGHVYLGATCSTGIAGRHRHHSRVRRRRNVLQYPQHRTR